MRVHAPLTFEVLAEHLGLPEGPVVASDGTLYAVDVDGGRVVRVSGGETTVAATTGGGPNGMALVDDHTAVIANNGGFLWTTPGGVRVPLDLVTHTNEPPVLMSTRSALNCAWPDIKTGVSMALKFLIDQRTPVNSGTFRLVDIVVPPDALFNALGKRNELR